MATALFSLTIDLDHGRSVTNDPDNVVRHVDAEVGGIDQRQLFYRDTMGRFDELGTSNGRFIGFFPCSPTSAGSQPCQTGFRNCNLHERSEQPVISQIITGKAPITGYFGQKTF